MGTSDTVRKVVCLFGNNFPWVTPVAMSMCDVDAKNKAKALVNK